ncbi:cornifelin -like protein [Brachionus plicatilis]|uniref:Cornifelin-like protein n=1 Tax=Brachionus plicatilis TaxID=10195 RepID=A0A3M7PFU5_BRAPC|nr:cornifelin -like protein [Brachionus plicatilis]
MTTITINSSQPVGGQTFKNFQNEFSAGLCDCFSDCGKCVFAYFCFPCFACQVFTDAGECMCTPFFCPHSSPFLRSKIRQGYRIEGQMWKDFLIFYFFGFCAMLQISNEMKLRGDAQ